MTQKTSPHFTYLFSAGQAVIRDLERGCSEISMRTASSKDEAKRIACLVSGRGLGKEARRGKRGVKKLIEGRRREVEVAQYEEPSSGN
jgi:hypothetical protein